VHPLCALADTLTSALGWALLEPRLAKVGFGVRVTWIGSRPHMRLSRAKGRSFLGPRLVRSCPPRCELAVGEHGEGPHVARVPLQHGLAHARRRAPHTHGRVKAPRCEPGRREHGEGPHVARVPLQHGLAHHQRWRRSATSGPAQTDAHSNSVVVRDDCRLLGRELREELLRHGHCLARADGCVRAVHGLRARARGGGESRGERGVGLSPRLFLLTTKSFSSSTPFANRLMVSGIMISVSLNTSTCGGGPSAVCVHRRRKKRVHRTRLLLDVELVRARQAHLVNLLLLLLKLNVVRVQLLLRPAGVRGEERLV
jgi:hypothetical protein